jgi:hypothetical protein
MGLIITIPDAPPRSDLPGGGSPRDDAAYLAWRTAFLDRAVDLHIARAWHGWLDVPATLDPFRFDSALFDALVNTPLFHSATLYQHRLRFLAIALRTQRSRVESLARRITTDGDGNS